MGTIHCRGTASAALAITLSWSEVAGDVEEQITRVGMGTYASIEPVLVGTIAMLDVTVPSDALSVETPGRVCIEGQRVRN